MKTLPRIRISNELDDRIEEAMDIADMSKADVIRHALRIGLHQFAARFEPPPGWLEERIREALVEPAEEVTLPQFRRNMLAIANGR
jgi:hypothetical protein